MSILLDLKRLARKVVSMCKVKKIVPIMNVVSEKQVLNGHVAFIIGGSGGIGKAIAKKFLESGCKVIITGTSSTSVSNALQEIAGGVKGIVFDLNACDEYDAKLAEAITFFGDIDIFVNTAGVHTNGASFWEVTRAEYDRVMKINLEDTFFICQTIEKYMKVHKIAGHILFVSSSRGSEPAYSPYSISKWGLNGFIKGLAKELIQYGIVVNGIAPGSTATPLIGVQSGDTIYSTENEVGRFVMPEEVASFAKMLVCDAGNMVIGEILTISGGRGIFDIR